MAGVITRGNTPKLLWPGLNEIWGIAYNEFKAEWKNIFEINKSTKAYEEDTELVGLGLAAQKTESQSISYDSMQQGLVSRYTNLTYALGYIITREELDDVLYPQFGRDRTIALARSYNQAQEYVGANILNRGFNGAYLGADGVVLYSTSHPTAAGVVSNRPSVAVDLSELALENALINISLIPDNRGNRINLQGRKLIVPPQLWFEAQRILKNPFQPDTAERNINAMYQTGMFPDGYYVNHYLNDPDAWFIITDCPNGMRYFERSAPRFESDNEFDTKNAKFSVYGRYSFGYTDFRGTYGSPGA